jgi:pSer/pThr/pTyr-binding forkhead associated (FHA) protein
MLKDIKNYYCRLEGKLKNYKSWTIPVENFPFIIGRNAGCNLTLDSKDVSRKHAQLFFNNNNLVICDLKSTNGTLVNHTKITGNLVLKDGDTIQVGDFEFQIYFNDPIKESSYDKTNLLKNPLANNSFIEYFKITKKEKEVLIYLLDGKSTAKIAEILKITSGTAKNHILSIYKKTETHSKFELLTLFNNFKEKN